MNGNSNIYYIGGSKGGLGKSLFSFVLADYLLNRERNILFVDTDTAIRMCSRRTKTSPCRICVA
jgi:cellulose biosynthesis protein BcsQ